MSQRNQERVPKIRDLSNAILKSLNKSVHIQSFISQYLEEIGFSDLESLDLTEKLTKNVKRDLKNRLQNHMDQGTTASFEINRDNDDYIIPLSNLDDGLIESRTKKVLTFRPQIKQIIWKLNPREFEAVCRLVLEANGAYDCEVTQGNKEGGIDVFGWLAPEADSKEKRRAWKGLKIRLIGQGKHRNIGKTVNNEEVSKFITDIEKIRAQVGVSSRILRSNFSNSSAPLQPVLITNGRIVPGAKVSAKRAGIILWENEQICEDLIAHPLIDEWIHDDKFDEFRLKKYLKVLLS